MKRFMFRRPEFIEEASKSRYMPNPAAALGIGVLIFSAYFLVSMVVAMFLIVAAISKSGLENLMESVYSPEMILTILALEGSLVIFTIIHSRFIEKRPVTTLGFVKRGFALKFLAGFGSVAVLLALIVWPSLLSPEITYTGFTAITAVYFLVFVLVGAGEETLFRGYILTALLRSMGVVWSVVISSAFFTLFHLANGYEAEGMLEVFLLGVLFSLLMLRTGSIWGAIGAHISWNFIGGLITPIKIANYVLGYSIFSINDSTDQDTLSYLILFALFIAAVALILFAGKGRLVVRKTRGRQMYEDARRLAVSACAGILSLNGKPYFKLVRRVAEAAKGEDAKTAAFLSYAIMFGSAPETGSFDKEVLEAAEVLAPAEAEDSVRYGERVSGNATASRVLEAENAIRVNLGAGYDLPGQTDEDELLQCPMLGWSIKRRRCVYFSDIVNAENMVYNMNSEIPPDADREKCRQCPNRRMGQW